ncbi:unnamed protein product [Caenorhabditis auriculariae]|uniref:Uncharacterized protein n=1 Tax=Caenorhabditis auriculariae TaxID=2777116 RepID=A0A8S1GPF0_9PELO|nr:unnamed protein product [Caenorhabditis auriculariae]
MLIAINVGRERQYAVICHLNSIQRDNWSRQRAEASHISLRVSSFLKLPHNRNNEVVADSHFSWGSISSSQAIVKARA